MVVTGKLLVIFGAILAGANLVVGQDLDWWKTAVFYQVYPRSFMDSNGDGIGDLQGITAKLDHLKDLGFQAVWLSPIFSSPQVDFGYDVSDFIAIDPSFGTMEDFDALVTKSKELDIKVILDFVPNHSSDEHDWFQKAIQNDPIYKDYYVWRDGRGLNDTGSPIPPNDWIGSFLESVWTYNELLGQFFYHRFNVKQPDLNFRNEDLRNDMRNVLRFWLDKGVHGFRVDSIQVLVEDERYPDVPNSESDLYCLNQPLTFDVVREWRQILDEYTATDGVTRVMILEAFGKQEELIGYYGNDTHPGAHFVFNFQFIFELNNQSKAQDYINTINEWIDNLPVNSASNWVIGNHDTTRVATRYGTDLAAGIAMLALLLPGIGIIYNGEEIGMVNNWDITYEETLDPLGINAGPDGYLEFSRDFERTPFQWDDTENAGKFDFKSFVGFYADIIEPCTNIGFSTGNKTWLPVHSNYKTLNLELEKSQPTSYYNLYKNLMAARTSDAFKNGSLSSVAISENVVGISRDLQGVPSYLSIVNLGEAVETMDLDASFGTDWPMLYVVASNAASLYEVGIIIQDANQFVLQPQAAVVLKSVVL